MKEDLRKSSPTNLVTKLDKKKFRKPYSLKNSSRYPDDLFCAEEGCLRAAVKEFHLDPIDPIDGANNFVAGWYQLC